MNDPTDLPLALYQANFDLQVRIGELLQDSGRHWLEFGQRLVNDGLVENGAELQQLMAATAADFSPIYARLSGSADIPAGELREGDTVLQRGSGEGWLADGDV